jgi:tRNA A37 methylthiotransferase MiaB
MRLIDGTAWYAELPEKNQAARASQAEKAAQQIIDQAQRDYWNQKQKFTISSRRKSNEKRKGQTSLSRRCRCATPDSPSKILCVFLHELRIRNATLSQLYG